MGDFLRFTARAVPAILNAVLFVFVLHFFLSGEGDWIEAHEREPVEPATVILLTSYVAMNAWISVRRFLDWEAAPNA